MNISKESVGTRLDSHQGWTNGFDYIRLVLSLAVIGWHSIFTSYGYQVEATVYASWVHPIMYPILPMFFALGGFLLSASFTRSKTFNEYLMLRVLRIFPAWLVVVFISAIILGPLMTSDSISAYFKDSKFITYVLNLGVYQEELPALFEGNPGPRVVNISLWTMPWELVGSIAFGILLLVQENIRAKLLLAIAACAMVVVPAAAIVTNNAASLYERPPGHLLVLAFLAGTCLYHLRYKIPLDPWLFAACAVLSFVLCIKAKTAYLAPIPITYVTVYLGLLHPPKYGFMKRADFSYAVYLYGCVVQQTLMSLYPSLRVWWLNWIVASCIAGLCAAASWYLIEGPILSRKRRIISFLVDRRASRGGNLRSAEENN
jgi:peptidoglycan/LPS O-acetylase OafA/YrhL